MGGLFRDGQGDVRTHLSEAEGPTFRENPLDFLILLARYKFPARLIDKTDHVLDAGCGHGLGSVFLRPFASSVVGLDADSTLVDHCRSTYGDLDRLEFEVGDVRDIRSDSLYDAAVSMDVIEHLSVEDGRRMLESLRDVVRPGGLIVIGTPNARSGEFASPRRRATHEHEYGFGEFKQTLSDVFGRAMLFSMTDETVGTGFGELAWYLMGVCVRL